MNLGCREFLALRRRDFLRVGGTGLFGLTLADLFRAQAAESKDGPGKARQMLFIFLPGGPPHIDSFDMKPEAPAEIRGEFKPIKTNVPGIEIAELMPRLAKLADKYTILRSCTTGIQRTDHEPE